MSPPTNLTSSSLPTTSSSATSTAVDPLPKPANHSLLLARRDPVASNLRSASYVSPALRPSDHPAPRQHSRPPAARSAEEHRHRHSISLIAREKTTAVLTNLGVKSRTSTSSLRSQPNGAKQNSSSTHRSSRPENGSNSPSSPSSRENYNTSTSVPPVDHSLVGNSHKNEVRPHPASLEAPRPGGRSASTERYTASTRPLLDRSPSPSKTVATRPYDRLPENSMHQTSSRLLRMTDEDRPFTRDFKDLFSTLMVSLPLSSHRIRFQKVEHTFTSEEAINNLGSLKFSQSNRMPDPKDPSRIVTTTTTTTFSMAKEMARSVCQRFMDARFIETADTKPLLVFPLKGALWQLTPKGMFVLQRFCQRNGIHSRHVLDVLDSARNTMQLVILERDPTTDKLSHDRATVEVIFRRFAGQDGPNLKATVAMSDSDSLSDYYNGMVGVKIAKERKVMDRVVQNTFTGKAAVDWLMDCCTTVERRETFEIAESFVQHGLIWAANEDKIFVHQNPHAARFQPTKNAIYGITEKGQRVAGWISRESSPSGDPREMNNNSSHSATAGGHRDVRTGPRDSNNNRLLVIVNDAALRLLFREYLRDTHCEENLAFFLEVRDFTKNYDISERAKAFTRLDAIRESLAAAYGLYNAFLAPGSPCELNIDHNLRNSLAGRMTRAVGDDDSMLKSLQEVVALFKEAQASVFKLMSSDSVPKFLKEPRYAGVLREHNFDTAATNGAHHSPSVSTLPERTLSRSVRG